MPALYLDKTILHWLKSHVSWFNPHFAWGTHYKTLVFIMLHPGKAHIKLTSHNSKRYHKLQDGAPKIAKLPYKWLYGRYCNCGGSIQRS